MYLVSEEGLSGCNSVKISLMVFCQLGQVIHFDN